MAPDSVAPDTAEVFCHVESTVATVTLCHPRKLNAMSRAMWRQLRSVFAELQGRSDVRCVVVRGISGHFCAGGDIAEYPDFRFDESTLRDFHENDVWGGLQAMLACDIPLVACIEGNCMGAGIEIASCCDIRLASTTARFGAPIAKLGFPMAPHEARLVAGALGEITAREMLLSAAVLCAEDLLQRGFLNAALPPDALDAAVLQLVERTVGLSPMATRLNKQTLRALEVSTGESSLAALSANAYGYASEAEHKEGVMAFLEKRAPDF